MDDINKVQAAQVDRTRGSCARLLLSTGTPAKENASHKFARSAYLIVVVVVVAALSLLSDPISALSQQQQQQQQQPFELIGRAKIVGLYDDDSPSIQSIQGRREFEQAIMQSNQTYYTNGTDGYEPTDRISIVQFYMATCPDCQGFAPYFRRFISDIGSHWSKLIKVFVVNCNDDLNINLCWEQNPKLIVPLVRWYAYPRLQQMTIEAAARNETNTPYPRHLLSASHRESIERQRRDAISLRHGTLRFISSMVEELIMLSNENRTYYRADNGSLPMRWQLIAEPLGRSSKTSELIEEDPLDTFRYELLEREHRCLSTLNLSTINRDVTIDHYVVVGRRHSQLGRTVVADWSDYVCKLHPEMEPRTLALVHHSNELSLLSTSSIRRHLELINSTLVYKKEPVLLKLVRENDDDYLKWQVLAVNDTAITPVRRNRREAAGAPIESGRLGQRKLLDRYYNRAKTDEDSAKLILNRRARAASTSGSGSSKNNSLDAENINWAPEELYGNEESLRYEFNRQIERFLRPKAKVSNLLWSTNDTSLGKIEMNNNRSNASQTWSARDEDSSLLRLTDYYKVLDEILHKNLISRAHVDGFQLLASTCWLKQLARHFPFQGAGSDEFKKTKSITLHYIELMQRSFSEEFRTKLDPTLSHLASDCGLRADRSKTEQAFVKVRVPSAKLSQMQSEIRRHYKVGTPAESNFQWTYCNGSETYLRGHTCSLWVLFHTLTVHEYLAAQTVDSPPLNNTERYQFQIDTRSSNTTLTPSTTDDKQMSQTNEGACKYGSSAVEDALLNAPSGALYVGFGTDSVLASIINFVRFYLSCTNCAAHFSCMVNNTPNLYKYHNLAGEGLRKSSAVNSITDELAKEVQSGNHMLWLWEAHNRVNIRTKGTHSEDPTHPKHIFPDRSACPQCYLPVGKDRGKKKSKQAMPIDSQLDLNWFDDIAFNKTALIEFLVAHYRRSSILNNKIQIEQLYLQQEQN